ncbi:hypothetical protein EJ03DRAFT_4996 [Teratosphaeria nubilosa]|uniref:DUF6604 domain-containing protein n=1 Tax=Teratosphaeria nubilosa TaxID=161662 RepID=A0A6G1LNV7_9PEZI|nr:hypothetical protein EJ03DRAFT_4996 [Teratosphaeria nubilosa]
MDRGSLIAQYLRYKEGTDKLVEWLATEAQKCGGSNISKLLPTLRDAKEAVRKAKKGRGADRSATTVLVRVADLITLAKIVASSKLPIPHSIISMTKDVIAGRQACADVYAKSLAEKDVGNAKKLESDNQGHQHFIAVLQQVLDLLSAAYDARPLQDAPTAFRRRKVAKEPDKEPENKAQALANMFAQLNIQKPSNKALGAAPAGGKAGTEAPKVRFELEAPEDQVKFAVLVFLKDMCEVRGFVEATWKERVAGTISFAAAGFLTSTASAIIRRAEKQLLAQFPQLHAYLSAFAILLDIDQENYADPTQAMSRLTELYAQAQQSGTADLMCLDSAVEILELAALSTRDLSKPWQIYLDMSKVKRVDRTPERLFKHIKRLLPLLAAALRVDGATSTLGMHDAFTATIANWLLEPGSGAFPISLVLCFDMIRRAHEILGPDSIASGHRIALDALQVDRAVVENFSARTNTGAEGYRIDANLLETWMIGCATVSRRYVHDPPRLLAQKLVDGEAQKYQDYCLYKSMILTPWLNMWFSRTMVHAFGMRMCNIDRLVLSTAYLYKVAKETCVLQAEWADMDYVIGANSKQSQFVRQSSTGPQAYAKYFGMALGMKASAFSGDWWPKLPHCNAIDKNARGLQDQASLLTQIVDKDFVRGNDIDDNLVSMALRCLQWKDIGDDSPARLLHDLKQAYLDCEVDFNFPYLTFAEHCRHVLTQLHQIGAPLLAGQKSQLPGSPTGLAYSVLRSIADSANQGKLEHDPLLLVLRDAIISLVGGGIGGELIKEARAQSSECVR